MLTKHQADDHLTFAGFVNRVCKNIQQQSLKEDQFKRLSFIPGLHFPRDINVRIGQQSKLEQQKYITTVCQRLFNLKRDNQMIQQAMKSSTHWRMYSKKRSQPTYWSCGKWYY